MNESPSSPAPVRAIDHVDALPVGARLAEFEILGLLGVGGFGMVYKAFDHSLHRAVAIKEYMPSALAGRSEGQSLWVRSSSDHQTFQAGLESFVGEARLLAQFDHPSLVKVFRFWEANGTAYMVMPLYTGMTLKQARTHMRTPPPEAWLRKLLWSVLGALRVLHDGKTLHRDISPDNIFLQDNGPPVLLDLGAARHAINDQGRNHTAVLKVNYAPIEQYADGDTDLRQGPWSDLYSLGAVVHGCLCNDTPLPATLRSIRDRMVSFSRVARTVKRQFGVEYSAAFVAAVSKALHLKPEDRPQSIDAFLQLMEMTSPPDGVDHFDFRADLGDIWVEPSDQTAKGFVTPTVDLTSLPAVSADPQNSTPFVRAAESAQTVVHSERSTDDVQDTVMLTGPDTVAADGGDTVFMGTTDALLSDAGSGPAHHAPPSQRRQRASKRGHRRAVDPESLNASAKEGRAAKPSSAVVWFLMAACAVIIAAAGYRWVQGGKPAQDPIITEYAEPAPAVAVSASEVAQTPQEAASTLVAVAEEPASTPALAAASMPAPAAVMASTPAPRAAPRSARRQVVEPVPAPVIVHEDPPPAPPPPVLVVETKPRPAPRVPTPQEVCAEANFLARPMCIHQECQKPSQSGHPVCVENRRRYEAEEQRRRLTPN